MKKFFCCVLFLFSACGGVVSEDFGEKFEFYELSLDGETFYFSYPASAIISEMTSGDISIGYENCDVGFGLMTYPDYFGGEEIDREIVDRGEFKYMLDTKN